MYKYNTDHFRSVVWFQMTYGSWLWTHDAVICCCIDGDIEYQVGRTFFIHIWPVFVNVLSKSRPRMRNWHRIATVDIWVLPDSSADQFCISSTKIRISVVVWKIGPVISRWKLIFQCTASGRVISINSLVFYSWEDHVRSWSSVSG